MSIVVIGLNHRSSSVTVRERFAFDETSIPKALESLRGSGIAEEGVILSTCNRVEIYAATPLEGPAASAALREFLTRFHDFRDPLNEECYVLAEPDSLHHLFKVASGLDSMVFGETENRAAIGSKYCRQLR